MTLGILTLPPDAGDCHDIEDIDHYDSAPWV